MIRVRFFEHLLGVPDGAGGSVAFLKGEVARIDETQFDRIWWRRTRDNGIIVKRADDDLATRRCADCGRDFIPEAMDDHRSFFHTKKAVPRETHVCFDPGCRREFDSEKGLTVHQAFAKHGPYRYDRPSPIHAHECRLEGCERTFETEHGRKIHEARMHQLKVGTGPP